MPRYKLVDGVRIQFTADEETARDSEESSAQSDLEKALENIRAKREVLLQETDFYGNSDVTMSADMVTYRQNLRDITNGLDTVEKVNNVTWPTKP
tara:strand:- start:1406 stop:1690 length:285 start_codon:yes stop_codon:yes gene_type:complete